MQTKWQSWDDDRCDAPTVVAGRDRCEGDDQKADQKTDQKTDQKADQKTDSAASDLAAARKEAKEAQDRIGALQKELDTARSAEDRKRIETELGEVKRKAEKAEATSGKWMKIAQERVRRDLLPGALHDDVYGMAPLPELDDAGQPTEAAKKALEEWRAARPKLFAVVGKGTPGSGGQRNVEAVDPALIARVQAAGVRTSHLTSEDAPDRSRFAPLFGRRTEAPEAPR